MSTSVSEIQSLLMQGKSLTELRNLGYTLDQLHRAGCFNVSFDATSDRRTTSGRRSAPPQRFVDASFQKGSGSVKRKGYDGTDMIYNGSSLISDEN